MEPSPVATHARPRHRAQRGLQVAAGSRRPFVTTRTTQAAAVGAGLAAASAALAGADHGIVWMIGGVWLVRAVWGCSPGLGWGFAMLAAGVRWGTLSLADVQAATRAIAPTLAAGPTLAVAASAVCFAAAVAEEARLDGLRARSVPERLAAGLAIAALVPAFCAPGPGVPTVARSLGWWAAAGLGLAVVALAGSSAARRLPAWAPAFLGAAGLAAAGFAAR